MFVFQNTSARACAPALRHFVKRRWLAVLLAAGCCLPAGTRAEVPPAPASGPQGGFARVVVFGDSLSDNGAYTLAALLRDTVAPPYRLPYERGGQFSVNQASSPNWSDLLARRLELRLSPNLVGFRVGGWELFLTPERPVRSVEQANCAFDPRDADGVARCTNHAQGGSRVADEQGIGHDRGALTYPVSRQWQRHLQQFGEPDARELLIVLAGNNDVFAAFAHSQATAGQAWLRMSAGRPALQATAPARQAEAQAEGLARATPEVQAAADALAGLVGDMLARGARYVLVGLLPDAALTPYGQRLAGGSSCDRQDPAMPCHALSRLVDAFNARLRQALEPQPVAWLDLHALFEQQMAQPRDFGLENVRDPWCDAALPSSLLCNLSTPATAAGADAGNLGTWLFADDIHPTPVGHRAMADRAYAELLERGWVEAPAPR